MGGAGASNELIIRGFAVDVGVVEVVTKGEDDKRAQETCSLKNSGDFFRKIVVLDGNQKLWTDQDGISYVGVIPFLLDKALL